MIYFTHQHDFLLCLLNSSIKNGYIFVDISNRKCWTMGPLKTGPYGLSPERDRRSRAQLPGGKIKRISNSSSDLQRFLNLIILKLFK